jgi:uncharacterized protein (TIGR00255 family)
MTGYASASSGGTGSGPGAGAAAVESSPMSKAAVTVDLRSVNGRFLDLSLRLPDELRGLEPALRELVGSQIRRGKVELRLSTQRETDNGWPLPSAEQLNRLGRLEATVIGWLPHAPPLSVNEVMQWCRGSAAPERLDEVSLDAARRAIDGLREARGREGARLVQLLLERVTRLRELCAQAEPLVPAVVRRQQQRFLDRWAEALSAAGAAQTLSPESMHERALNESTAYAIRIDVAEELGRLKAHLDEIDRLLTAGGELGKRLDFLIQELQREANTLGSKSAALEMTNLSVEMKVLIEQMREQVQNIE